MAITLAPETKKISLQLGVYNELPNTFTRTSALQEVEVVDRCANYEYYFTWLNNLGGWEYWLFKGQKDHRVSITEDVSAQRNIFADWDIEFVSAETEQFFTKIRAYEESTIRSQPLTKAQADGVSKIRFSIQVQRMDKNDQKRTVLVDKANFRIRKDGDFFSEISFNIRETSEIPIQEQ